MKLTSDQKKLCSNLPKAIVGAYEYGNEELLSELLRLSTPEDRRKARSMAILSGVDIDWQPSDAGNY